MPQENSQELNSNMFLRDLVALGVVTFLTASLNLGPIDLARSVYNASIGNTPVLKEQLVDYSRRDIRRKNLGYTPQQVEQSLAAELKYKLEGDSEIDPQKISMDRLWKTSESHARTWAEKWIWVPLEDQI